MELIFATANKHKLSEAQAILGNGFSLVVPYQLGLTEEIPETADTLKENAIMKAKFLWDKFGRPCFADDTGLEVDFLNGRPGVYSARYAGIEADPVKNMQKLLKELNGANCRKARFVTIVALILDENRIFLFEGALEGTILEASSGCGGFGYDPLFMPEGYSKTLAELSAEEKNRISHRGIAMRKLSDFLNNNFPGK
ncbi:MAG: RdgB/HAM1 family non-canonical purine NTP pyrophosphatase [Bacteroidales bacterium]|nr:RdgB/HAM1 family non-canonical purine NTP pyrophosphatase [Bacteroidales bacterium]MDD2280191.1 RdgB/HAM1 family non-canonical purine NTP pyrophosphatase [Bacteroidales bacterium]MDD4292664.1 RdgB/HAM1 family non-canonical purine NTP pyrophosphatase [Bacteroidales bacterium]MDD4491077.1 RdgB/HAM1 family non-canonical purine NTP pyrophosphatase [Bacteroidales bacterium]HNW49225.1 RdgB/HAM1 family non-canonical purine NTP pyrophosphatase [Bacteroidales bacterium]